MTLQKRIERARRGTFRRWKRFRQRIVPKPANKNVFLIVGCQRSGTTLMSRIFERDYNTISFGEASVLSTTSGPSRLRLRSLDDVESRITDARARFIVMKPLVESQNVSALLDHFPDSRALWLYRNYRDVAASNLAKFGDANSTKDIRIIAEGDPGNWRRESLSDELVELARSQYSPDMRPADAAVLFWIIRNRLYFDLALNADPRLQLCRYESLTTTPALVMRRIYEFAGQPYPGDHITTGTHPDSISKGRELEISRDIDELADSMLSRLDAEWDREQAMKI